MSVATSTAEIRRPKAIRIEAEQPADRPAFRLNWTRVIAVLTVIAASALVALMLMTAPLSVMTGGYHDTVSGDTTVVAAPAVKAHAATKAKKAVVVPTNGKLGKQAAAWLKAADPTGAYRKARLANIALVVAIGNKRHLDDRTIAIAVGTCIQESKCTNWNGGDRHSHGLFQQQYNMGWGTLAQTMDRVHATNAFYDRLVEIPNRNARPMMVIASLVQIPGMQYYIRDWYWDQIAPQFVKYFSTNDAHGTSK